MVSTNKEMIFGFLEYLNAMKTTEEMNQETENLDIAIQCLSTSFQLDLTDTTQLKQFSYRYNPVPNNTMDVIFQAGVKATGVKTLQDMSMEMEKNPVFIQFLNTVKDKGFFGEYEEGSPEYLERYVKVVGKFKQKLDSKAAGGGGTGTATTTINSNNNNETTGSDVDFELAETLKGEGNKAIQLKDYELAIDLYTQAIDKCSAGKNSHIYFCNRAAARCHLEDYSNAISDCEAALDLNDSYGKAYSRLGFAHFYQGNYEEAIVQYTKALELNPNVASNQSYLDQAREKLAKSSEIDVATNESNNSGTPAPQGMPDLSALLGGMGGGGNGGQPDLAGMMNNPAMMNMAQNMMQNPAMMNMAQNMMQDPAMMQNMMGMLGGGGGGNGQQPDISQLMNMMGGMNQGGPPDQNA